MFSRLAVSKNPVAGVIWSTVWSTIAEGASGRPPYRDTVNKPDLRLGYRNSKQAQQLRGAVSATLTVVNEIGVRFSVLGLLRSRDSHR